MIATDSSSLIPFLAGGEVLSRDVAAIREALKTSVLCLPPVVITELMSDPLCGAETKDFLLKLPALDILPDFWLRSAESRAKLLRHGFKAKLADTFIAQSCIDHHVPLITRDKDFRHYAKHCGLKLYHD